MVRPVIFCATVLLASPASAEVCPDFFRFTDFGLQDQSGAFSWGGPIMRVESLGGTTLLSREGTECRMVRETKDDAHGNPIPIVTVLAYDVAEIDFDLTDLRVSYADDTNVTAKANAKPHWDRIEGASLGLVQSPNSRCMVSADDASISCQLISPYSGNTPLVVYCDQTSCNMPVLAMNENMAISASWVVNATFLNEPELVGEAILEKVMRVYDFLDPLSSGVY